MRRNAHLSINRQWILLIENIEHRLIDYVGKNILKNTKWKINYSRLLKTPSLRYMSYGHSKFPPVFADDRSTIVRILPDEMTRTNGCRVRSGGLMGIVACRLFDGERGESKWGITSTRLRASVFPPQYPEAQWIPIIRECEMADLHVSCWLSGCVL